ncbi:hypothetical protein RclHR1_05470007 [Rhizophagus clarus]|uniref:P-loop containing nucleoside triphosphate hydrolase protein n=1 Tax=Rhizophagus clarus TaxID=94130 RepID=A0A2Z6RMH3_9GLOM|nr:hypothetical protein RclHR1_05470007 [Rhizophagus clarus]GES83860.1 P-loop containing nucleoside triphosphate hydrolase protein [Rhizophagus clarus]
MKVSLNCAFLIKYLFDSFIIVLNEINTICYSKINYSLKIGNIKSIIWNKKKKVLPFIKDSDLMNLWKVDIALNNEYFNEEQIKSKGVMLVPIYPFSKYFPDKTAIDESLIIMLVPATIATGQKRYADLESVGTESKRLKIVENVFIKEPPKLYPDSDQCIAECFYKSKLPISDDNYIDMCLD